MSNRIYPLYAIVGVGAVVIKDNSILLIKRGYPPGKGFWAVPGGVVEAGEELTEAVLRELKEETGLTGDVVGVVHVDEILIKENNSVKYHYVLIDFLIRNVKGEIRPGGDAVDVNYFELNKALKLPNVSKTTKKLIKRVKEKGLKILEYPIKL